MRRLLGARVAGALRSIGLAVFLALWLCGCTAPSRLSYADGARPVSRKEELPNTPVEHEHVWDVRKRVESTFTVESGFGHGGAEEVEGALRVSVPQGCADRTVHWKVTADGERIGHGSVRWLREYEAFRRLDVHGTPARITLTAWWDGGTGSCPAFGLNWHDPWVR